MSAREKILNAADKLFGEVGFDGASVREISEKSGVNKALIHYHFKSKEGLLLSVLDRYYEQLSDAVKPPLLDKGDFRDRILRLIDLYFDFLSKNKNFARIVQREATGGKHMERIRDRTIPIFQIGQGILREEYPFIQGGDLEAQQILISFYGMIITYFTYSDILKQLLGADPLSKQNLEMRKRHLRWMVDIVISEMTAQGALVKSAGA